MKIVFLTNHNPHHKGSWSGIIYQMYQGFEKNGFEIFYVGKSKPLIRHFVKIYAKLYKLFSNKLYDTKHSLVISKAQGKIYSKQINVINPDFVFAPAASSEIAFLDIKAKMIYTSDTTFALMNGYYDSYSHFCKKSIFQANDIEKRALQNANYVVYPSEWAAKSATEYYGIDKNKVNIIEYGSNLQNEKKYFPKEIYPNQPLKFLFLGIDWHRKGGHIVVDTLLKLHQQGIEVSLTICGCNPVIEVPFKVIIEGFLDKNIISEELKLIALLEDAHFLFVPSLSECFGIVYCEASSCGTPSLGINTGGVSSAIKHNINGICLENNHLSASNFAIEIKKMIQTPSIYREMSKNCIDVYQSTFRWDVFIDKVVGLTKK